MLIVVFLIAAVAIGLARHHLGPRRRDVKSARDQFQGTPRHEQAVFARYPGRRGSRYLR